MGGTKISILVVLFFLIVPAADSKRTNVVRTFPVYDNGGKPDLTIDPRRFVSQMDIVDRLFDESACALHEDAVSGTGYRRLLRFDTVVINSGDGDLVVGDHNDPNNSYAQWFVSSPCDGHYQIKDFSLYELLSLDRTVVLAQQKGSFSIEDSVKYEGSKNKSYNSAFQGITSGWAADRHSKQLDGQWIDITGVPEGDYIVRATINAKKQFDEGSNRYVNSVETRIHVPDPGKKVKIDDSPERTDR